MAHCQSMCPQTEIDFRTANHLISQLEATASTCEGSRSKFVADPNKMVKEYTRSAADTYKSNNPDLLRPFPVLNKTVDYLLSLYSPFKDRRKSVNSSKFSSIFSFVSDRLRSVRQDMVMQGMKGRDSITLIEKMLPFYIETGGLCKMEKCASYDRKLHDFQLEECFGRWFEEISIFSDVHPDPSIMACFFFRQLHEKSTLLHDVYLIRGRISSDTFEMIRSIISTFNSKNFRRFFVQFYRLNQILQLSLIDSISTLRKSAMQTISVAFKTPVAKIPAKVIADWLGFPANLEVFESFLRLYNVTPDENGKILISSIKTIVYSDLEYFSTQTR